MQTGYAMIVGAGSGTGAAVAKRLAAEGWPVVLTRRNATALARAHDHAIIAS